MLTSHVELIFWSNLTNYIIKRDTVINIRGHCPSLLLLGGTCLCSPPPPLPMPITTLVCFHFKKNEVTTFGKDSNIITYKNSLVVMIIISVEK